MSFLADRIIKALDMDLDEKLRPYEQTKRKLTTREHKVRLEGVFIKIKLSNDEFERLYLKKLHSETQFIKPEEASSWVNKFIVGKFTKDILDNQRVKEINSMDMMQTQSIVYNIESLTEMLLLCILAVRAITDEGSLFNIASTKPNEKDIQIMRFLFLEHLLAYAVANFRKWELKTRGQVDLNGVLRGKVESQLSIMLILCRCLFIGYIIHYLTSLTQQEFHSKAYIYYWMIIDCTIMLLVLGYVNLSQSLFIESDITKNIYSLYFLQSGHKYEDMKKSDESISWKELFEKRVQFTQFSNLINESDQSDDNQPAHDLRPSEPKKSILSNSQSAINETNISNLDAVASNS